MLGGGRKNAVLPVLTDAPSALKHNRRDRELFSRAEFYAFIATPKKANQTTTVTFLSSLKTKDIHTAITCPHFFALNLDIPPRKSSCECYPPTTTTTGTNHYEWPERFAPGVALPHWRRSESAYALEPPQSRLSAVPISFLPGVEHESNKIPSGALFNQQVLKGVHLLSSGRSSDYGWRSAAGDARRCGVGFALLLPMRYQGVSN